MRYVVLESVLLAMSVLQPIWDQSLESAATAARVHDWKRKMDMEEARAKARSRSPRRCRGVKALLKQWAKGETSAVAMWRVAHASVKEDGTDAGIGMRRIAGLANYKSGSETTVIRNY